MLLPEPFRLTDETRDGGQHRDPPRVHPAGDLLPVHRVLHAERFKTKQRTLRNSLDMLKRFDHVSVEHVCSRAVHPPARQPAMPTKRGTNNAL